MYLLLSEKKEELLLVYFEVFLTGDKLVMKDPTTNFKHN